MKHPTILAACLLAASVPALAQPAPAPAPPPVFGGPIQLQNPHRRGDGDGPMMGGRSGSYANDFPGAPNNGFNGGRPDFPGGNPMPMPALPVSMFADERYLFILRGDTLMQFDKKTLTLLKSVELPRPSVAAPPMLFPAAGGQGGAPTPDGQVRARTSPPLLKRPTFDMGHGPAF